MHTSMLQPSCDSSTMYIVTI